MAQTGALRREMGLGASILVGLGSIVGTGVFVSIALAAGITGGSVILALLAAALLATCNALSSAQLAAAHPVSGGTYEYGYRLLGPTAGFMAGWFFLLAKSTSAATAALACAASMIAALGWGVEVRPFLAGGIVCLFTVIVLLGVRRSNAVNFLIVGTTLLGLGAFVSVGLLFGPEAGVDERDGIRFLRSSSSDVIRNFLQATGLLFVAFTGYGRIATMAEEVRDPKRTIPRAIIITLGTTVLLYIAVAFVALRTVGARDLAQSLEDLGAPLQFAAARIGVPFLPQLVAISAATAMLGVLLNLILGLSRVYLAMGRRGDMPPGVANLSSRSDLPTNAVLLTGAVVLAITLLGSIRLAWSFSAFTVLLYYALTNAAALRLPADQRRYPSFIPIVGLLGCLGLAFWVDIGVWLAGLGIATVGLIWHKVALRVFAK